LVVSKKNCNFAAAKSKNNNNIMRKLITLLCCCLPLALLAQTAIQVGDYVFVKRTTTNYSTGEAISSWVYDEPHQVSQVDSKFHPNGILLNVRGAKSWLEVSDVLLCTPREVDAVVVPSTNKTETPSTSKVVVPTTAEPVVIHDTVTKIVEKIKVQEVVKVDTVVEKDTINLIPTEQVSFQMDVAMQATCGEENVGVGAHVTLGGRFTNSFFLGLGVGFEGSVHNMPNHRVPYTFQIPIYANTRIYFPVNGVSPFVDLAAGLNVRELNFEDIVKKEWICGLYSRAGVGVEWKRLLVGAGYQFTGGSKTMQDNIHQAYIKVGFRFLDK